jgi:hypothetical protein
MLDPENKPWCATKVDEEGIVVEGFWGHCHDTCPLDVNGTSISIILLSLKFLLRGRFT